MNLIMSLTTVDTDPADIFNLKSAYIRTLEYNDCYSWLNVDEFVDMYYTNANLNNRNCKIELENS